MDELLRRYGYRFAAVVAIFAAGDAALLLLHPPGWGRWMISGAVGLLTVFAIWPRRRRG